MKDHKYYLDEWNDLHCRLVDKVTSQERNGKMADFCEKMIIEAKDAYYNSGNPIMEDYTYDWFEDRLKMLRPDSKILEKVGS